MAGNDQPDTADRVIAAARRIVEAILIGHPGASVMPVFSLYTRDGDFEVMMPRDFSDAGKTAVAASVRRRAKETHAIAVSFMCESWMIKTSLDDPLDVMPAQSDKRIEVVQFSLETANDMRSAAWEIVRDGNGVVTALKDDALGPAVPMGGRFVGLLRP